MPEALGVLHTFGKGEGVPVRRAQAQAPVRRVDHAHAIRGPMLEQESSVRVAHPERPILEPRADSVFGDDRHYAGCPENGQGPGAAARARDEQAVPRAKLQVLEAERRGAVAPSSQRTTARQPSTPNTVAGVIQQESFVSCRAVLILIPV